MEIHRRIAVMLVLGLCAAVSPARAFDVEGRVLLSPPFPERGKFEVPEERRHSCSGVQLSDSLIVSAEGRVENALVWLEGDFKDAEETIPAGEPAALDQKDCRFEPHILLVPAGKSFRVKNSDPMGHDVRGFDGPEILFRFEMEEGVPPVEKNLPKPGRYVIRCGLHKWMHAYAVSIPHRFYAVSDAQGKFHFSGVPEGRYTVRIWHEKLGEAEAPLAVGESVRDFAYTFPTARAVGKDR